MSSRRRFLQYLAASPLAAQQQSAPALSNPKDALSVLDFEPAARAVLPPAHYGNLISGVDGDRTLRANLEAFNRFRLRPRRVIDVSKVDTSTTLFGTTWDYPISLAPVGSLRMYHPDGEIAAARAARARRALVILSTVTTTSIEQVAEAAGGPVWFQLYPTTNWDITLKLVRRAEAAGCPVLVLTVDLPAGRNTETSTRLRRTDTRQCETCHDRSPGGFYRRKPMFDGIDMKGVALYRPSVTWDFVRQLRDSTRMKLVLKGISAAEDARLSLDNGVDGIIVSNHGGRAEESGMGSIECLPEVAAACAGRIPVLVDGGIRRGTDVFKAIALGAKAVSIGRPYLWGMAAFGQPGVERVLELLKTEFELIMKQCGTRSLAEITRAFISEIR